MKVKKKTDWYIPEAKRVIDNIQKIIQGSNTLNKNAIG